MSNWKLTNTNNLNDSIVFTLKKDNIELQYIYKKKDDSAEMRVLGNDTVSFSEVEEIKSICIPEIRKIIVNERNNK